MNFQPLGLSAELWPLLKEQGITVPTPIQEQAIPIILKGQDLIGIAQTGTGKTLAFGLPILDIIKDKSQSALILAPTRELAAQIGASLRLFCDPLNISLATIFGGANMDRQAKDLRRHPRIVVATPGRLLDHVGQRNLRLDRFTVVVVDEADRMLDMGFIPALKKIFDQLQTDRQTLMLSATMPPAIAQLTQDYLKDPVSIEVAPQGTPVEAIEQAAYIVHQELKGELLNDLVVGVEGPVLVFARTRHGARKVAKALREYGHSAVELHADRTQLQRDTAMAGFRTGRNRVMVATDIASRGIDVKDISLVVQYDLPDQDEDYVHRIGRTGRAGASGRAVILVTPEHSKKLDGLERGVGFEIPTAHDSPLPRRGRTVKPRPDRPDTRRDPRPFSPKKPPQPAVIVVKDKEHEARPSRDPRPYDHRGQDRRPPKPAPNKSYPGKGKSSPRPGEPIEKQKPHWLKEREDRRTQSNERGAASKSQPPTSATGIPKGGRPKPSSTPKAFKHKRFTKKSTPSNGFQPPRKKRSRR